MLEINNLLKVVLEKNASDLHLVAGLPPKMRVNGRFVSVIDNASLTKEDCSTLAKQIISSKHAMALDEQGGVDLAYNYSERARFRCSVFKTGGVNNISIVMRLIPAKFLTFEELGLPIEAVADVLKAPRGLVLVTGPTGSGKSTTLATIINWINMHFDDVHVITIEDPIEYVHHSQKAIVNQREVSVDTPSFSAALRGALRQDPDVILIGEMRDLDTMETAINAAETGHLVFATLHTSSAADTVSRIINSFPTNQQEEVRIMISMVLRMIISQTIIPRQDQKGRVAAFEILHNIPAISNLIRENKIAGITSTMQINARSGMTTMDTSLLSLHRRKVISGEECLRRAYDRNQMQQQMVSNTEY